MVIANNEKEEYRNDWLKRWNHLNRELGKVAESLGLFVLNTRSGMPVIKPTYRSKGDFIQVVWKDSDRDVFKILGKPSSFYFDGINKEELEKYLSSQFNIEELDVGLILAKHHIKCNNGKIKKVDLETALEILSKYVG